LNKCVTFITLRTLHLKKELVFSKRVAKVSKLKYVSKNIFILFFFLSPELTASILLVFISGCKDAPFFVIVQIFLFFFVKKVCNGLLVMVIAVLINRVGSQLLLKIGLGVEQRNRPIGAHFVEICF